MWNLLLCFSRNFSLSALTLGLIIGLASPLLWAQDSTHLPTDSAESGLPSVPVLTRPSQLETVDPTERSWKGFSEEIILLQDRQQIEGLSYLVSGALAVILGGVGYTNSDDSAAKVAYSLTQSLGLAAAGYGYYRYRIGGQDSIFYESVKDSQSLSDLQRDDLTLNYLKQRNEQYKTNKWIRFLTHSMVAGLNIVYASQEQNQDVKTVLYFIGGINALAAVSVSF